MMSKTRHTVPVRPLRLRVKGASRPYVDFWQRNVAVNLQAGVPRYRLRLFGIFSNMKG